MTYRRFRMGERRQGTVGLPDEIPPAGDHQALDEIAESRPRAVPPAPGLPWLRAGSRLVTFALTAAAATILGIAIGGGLLSLRSGGVGPGASLGVHATGARVRPSVLASVTLTSRPLPSRVIATGTPSPLQFTADGVSWTAPRSAPFTSVMAVQKGYVATAAAGDGATGTTVYTSPDGIAWRTPPDPSIFSTTSKEPFSVGPTVPASGPAGYVMSGIGSDGKALFWLSRDGIRWTSQRPIGLSGDFFLVYPATPGYLATDLNRYWTSSNGKDWSAAGSGAFMLRTGEPGQPIVAGGEGGFSWFSADGGKTWARTGSPPKQKLLEWVVAFGGLYYGDWEMGGAFTLFTSRNMRTWSPVTVQGLARPASLAVFAGRLYAVDFPDDSTHPGTLWWTADGATWHTALDGSGKPIEANEIAVVGGRLFVAVYGATSSRLAWVATADSGTP